MISVKCREEERAVVEMMLRLVRSGPANYPAIHTALFIAERQYNWVFGRIDGAAPVTEQFLSALYPECGFRSGDLRCKEVIMGFGPDHDPLGDRMRELGLKVDVKPSTVQRYSWDLPRGAQ